ncbi:MAG: sensor domain-containing diguanylate cyclase [Candidatus Coatesbacteria bacterium]
MDSGAGPAAMARERLVRRLMHLPLRGPVAAAALGFALTAVCALAYTRATSGAARLENNVLGSAAGVSQGVAEAEMHCQSYLATGNTDALRSYRAASARIDESVADLVRWAGLVRPAGFALMPLIRGAERRIDAWRDLYAKRAIALKLRHEDRKVNELNKRRLSTWLSGDMHEAMAAMGRVLGATIEQTRSRSRLPQRIYLGGTLAGMALLLGAGLAVSLRGVRIVRTALERGASIALLNDWAEKIQFVDKPDQAVRMLRAVLNAEAGIGSASVLMLAADGSELAEEGYDGRAGASARALEGCPAMRTGQRYVVAGPDSSAPCTCPLIADTSGGMACIPLLAHGRTVGLVHLTARPGQPFPPQDLERAETYARLASLTIGSLLALSRAEEQATTDVLTGMFNRRFLDGYLDKQTQIAKRHQEPLAVLMLDIDFFKAFNDRHGHPAGDVMLKALGRALALAVRDGDLVARYGGEEFEAVRLPEMPDLPVPAVTVSIGVACLERPDEHAADLLRVSDAALYRAKAAGRNRVEA